ncbi:MAG: hypothetical protein A2279_12665 [Stygiobacter sp. RIFOXYA12_FULL_38_9]|nr:MAG: hypothetical protein A2279_12665 [Stygiobacter sp. RIFOXYA12_FULL_38_9]
MELMEKQRCQGRVSKQEIVVEVIIGPGKKGKIIMHKGESPARVSRKFAQLYKLNKTTEVLLQNLLEKELVNSSHH